MATAPTIPTSIYNPANFVRTVKLRSDVDATYSPRYNRLQYSINPDDLSTDLSESYLALRMYLTHQSGVQYTKQELIDLAEKNTYVSFGQNGNTYSPMCLVKLCRLFTGNMQLLEETQFSNVLSECLNQIYSDFESVGSSSLTSNSSVVFGVPQSLGAYFANILPDAIATGGQLPIEVHIPLKKLFGFFRNKNVYLNDPALMGLKIWLELEDRKPLLQAITCVDTIDCPDKETDVSGGLIYSLAVNPYTSLTAQNSNGQMTQNAANLPTNTLVPTNADAPTIMRPPSLTIYADQITSFFNANIAIATDTLVLTGGWTNQTLTQMSLIDGATLKLNFRMKATAGLTNQRQDQIVSAFTTITDVSLNAGVPTITVSNTFRQWGSVQWATFLDTVEVIAPERCVKLLDVDSTDVTQLQQENTIPINQAQYDALEYAGLISAAGTPTNSPFVLNTQMTCSANSTLIDIQPYFDLFQNADVPTSRAIISNCAQKLPIQGSSCRLLAIDAVTGVQDVSYNLVFSDLGMYNNNSLQQALFLDGNTYTQGQNVGGHPVDCNYSFWITNFNVSIDPVPADDYSYSIDKAELVLIQQAKDPRIPMSRVYPTWRVEVATIETPLPIYQRQFIVTEPNCYSILLCTPQYSTSTTPYAPGTDGYEPQSLISFGRGVQAYRWSINNIDDTNRDVVVSSNTSFYPSSLHVEKLMDSLQNDGDRVAKSLSGILTVPHSVNPVVALPLKVYDVREGMNYVMKPQGYTVQITLYGDVAHGKPVTAGPIFLFKHCLRTI